MSYDSTVSNEFAAQARALGQSAAPKDERRKADRSAPKKLRRFAAIYVMTLSTAMLIATALVFDLSGVNMGQPGGQKSAVVTASMAGAPDDTATAMTIKVFGVTLSFPARD